MSASTPATSRSDAIDHFRGCATLLMVLANYLMGVKSIPAWLKHSPDVGLTIVDVGAPVFLCAIGFTYGLSWRKRSARDGRAEAVQHFLVRYLALLGVGAIISAGQIALERQDPRGHWGLYWGVLQAIGVAGLLTLPLIRLRARWRLLIGLALLAVYQVLLDRLWLGQVLRSGHGGLPGSLSWTALLIIATALADFRRDWPGGRRWLPAVAALMLGVGLAVALIAPVSKNRVSASYVLVGLGIAGLIFALFDWLVEQRRSRSPWLVMWGRNPFLLYGLHYLALAVFTLPGAPWWYTEAPLWLVAVQALFLIAVLSVVAWWLHKRRIIYSF